MRRPIARTLALRALVIALLTLIALAAAAPWWLPQLGRWTTADRRAIPDRLDAIVVVAGDNGRLEEGIRLFQQGVAHELWHTGNGEGIVEQAVTSGIPREAIRLLQTNSTWEDGKQIRRAIEDTGARQILIVTSWYHGRRTQRTIEKQTAHLKVELFHRSVAPLGYDDRDWWTVQSGRHVVRSEILKSIYYLFTYGVSMR